LSSSVDSYKHHSDIRTDIALLRSRKAVGCFRKVVRSDIGGLLPAGAQARRLRLDITTRRTRNQARNVIGTISVKVLVAVAGRRLELRDLLLDQLSVLVAFRRLAYRLASYLRACFVLLCRNSASLMPGSSCVP
jgi:hypothetical protein